MRTGWLAWVLTAALALTPKPGWCQQETYELPQSDPQFPLPLGHDRMAEVGGFYAAGEFIYWRMTNPLKSQVIAIRGLSDTDGTLQEARNFIQQGFLATTGLPPLPVIPGQFFGSGLPALDVEQVAGPGTWDPGLRLTLGWRFQDGFSLAFNWTHLPTVKYAAGASVVPPNFAIGKNGEDQFLFSPVFNFPPEFSGPANKLQVVGAGANGNNASFQIIPVRLTNGAVVSFQITASAAGNGTVVVPQAAYGIWNAATIMSESFIQRGDQFDLIGRIPIFQDDCTRFYALIGPRHVQMWERFFWRTVSVATSNPQGGITITASTGPSAQVTFNPNGQIIVGPAGPATATITVGSPPVAVPAIAGADDVADYSNVVSNRMYGPTIGCGTEYYLAHGFSLSFDAYASGFIDIVKERAKYERQDHAIATQRSRTEYSLVPELRGDLNLWWYPIEAVQLRLGYEVEAFFNTISAPRPVDFNYGSVAPAWEKNTFRVLDGFHAGLGFIF